MFDSLFLVAQNLLSVDLLQALLFFSKFSDSLLSYFEPSRFKALSFVVTKLTLTKPAPISQFYEVLLADLIDYKLPFWPLIF